MTVFKPQGYETRMIEIHAKSLEELFEDAKEIVRLWDSKSGRVLLDVGYDFEIEGDFPFVMRLHFDAHGIDDEVPK